MDAFLRVSLIFLSSAAFISAAGIVSVVHASDGEVVATNSSTPSDADHQSNQTSSTAVLSTQLRSSIKRQIMSTRGVLLDMANLTDNGYAWTNDAVWNGTGVSSSDDKSWYTAGFFFERTGYKGVWLQYAFTLNAAAGKVSHVKRWYGVGTFR